MAGVAANAGQATGQQVKSTPLHPAPGHRRRATRRCRPRATARLPVARTPAFLMTESDLQPDDTTIHEDGLWRDNGWTARIIKNEDDDGWAVEGGARQAELSGQHLNAVYALIGDPFDTVALDEMTDLLWDDPPPSAVKTIRSHISRLRTALESAGVDGAIERSAVGYRLTLADAPPRV